jgi:hypothetical protein
MEPRKLDFLRGSIFPLRRSSCDRLGDLWGVVLLISLFINLLQRFADSRLRPKLAFEQLR